MDSKRCGNECERWKSAVDIVGNKYSVDRVIELSSHAQTCLGTNTAANEEVTIKLESVQARRPRLTREADVLKSLSGSVGFPLIRHVGTDDGHHALVFDRLGPSLEQLFNLCNRKFSLKTVLLLAEQLITRMEIIHDASLIHQSIRPASFVVGQAKLGAQVLVVSFENTTRHNDESVRPHVPAYLGESLAYASINSHLGVAPSWCDDMESLGYLLLYFLNGSLPWFHPDASLTDQQYESIMEAKRTTPIDDLCSIYPGTFTDYFTYIHNLAVDERPDYDHVRDISRYAFKSEGLEDDRDFDWNWWKWRNHALLKRAGVKPEDRCVNEWGVYGGRQQVDMDVSGLLWYDSRVSLPLSLDRELSGTAETLQSTDRELEGKALWWPRHPGLLVYLACSPITQDEIRQEVNEILKRIEDKEKLCEEAQRCLLSHPMDAVTLVQWQSLVEAHRALLNDYWDLLITTQLPSADQMTRGIPASFNRLGSLRGHRVYGFLQILSIRGPQTQDHLLKLFCYTYQLLAALLETTPDFRQIMMQWLGDLAELRTTMEESMATRTHWQRRARYWRTHSDTMIQNVSR